MTQNEDARIFCSGEPTNNPTKIYWPSVRYSGEIKKKGSDKQTNEDECGFTILRNTK
jgi:hypothetical protein